MEEVEMAGTGLGWHQCSLVPMTCSLSVTPHSSNHLKSKREEPYCSTLRIPAGGGGGRVQRQWLSHLVSQLVRGQEKSMQAPWRNSDVHPGLPETILVDPVVLG